MKMTRQLLGLCLLLCSLSMSAYSDQHLPQPSGNKNNMSTLNLYFNQETGAQFAARTQANTDNPLPTTSTTFYYFHWDKNPIDIQIEHGQNSLRLHHVIGVQTSVAKSHGLIANYRNISADLTDGDTMSHDQARLTMLLFLYI